MEDFSRHEAPFEITAWRFLYDCLEFYRNHKVLGTLLLFVLFFLVFRLSYSGVFFCLKLSQPPVGHIEEIQTNDVTVRIERIPDPPFFYCMDFTVGPDGKRYAYTSCEFKWWSDSRWCVVDDGKSLTVHRSKILHYLLMGGTQWPYASIAFSSDGRRLKYNRSGTVFVDDKPVSLSDADRVIDVLFLPENRTAYYLEQNGTTRLQIDSGMPVPYSKDIWLEAVAVNAGMTSLAFKHFNRTLPGSEIVRDGTVVTGLSENDWPFVFDDEAEPVYVFLAAQSFTLRGPEIFAPCTPVFKNNPYKNSMSRRIPGGFLTWRKAVPLNSQITKEINIALNKEAAKINIGNRSFECFRMADGDVAASGLELDPDRLVLFGKCFGCLYRIDFFTNKEQDAPGAHP